MAKNKKNKGLVTIDTVNQGTYAQIVHSQASDNRAMGKIFESFFKSQAEKCGLLATKNDLTGRYLPGGRIKLIKSELDFRLVNQKGKVGFFDCKTFLKDYFTYSELNEDQVETAASHNLWNVPSGFVVWFRVSNEVVFFTGQQIVVKGPQTRFEAEDGLSLGSIENFNLSLVLVQK